MPCPLTAVPDRPTVERGGGLLGTAEVVVEPGEVARAEVDQEVVGHDAAALDVDGSMIVHLAHETATQLDRANRTLGATSEHTVDHTLQATLD